MKTSLLILTFTGILLLASCDKGNPTNPVTPKTYADFLKNTEWVGTLDGSGFQYRPPCSLKFNADNTFTMYSLFVFFPNGVEERRDSISGTIASIDSLADGRTRINTTINTSFQPTVTKSIYITGRQKLQGISSDQSTETFQLSLFPAKGISVNGEWSGPLRPGKSISYPDVSTITFLANEKPPRTYYNRNGTGVLLSPPNILLKSIYQQKGARVYFGGCNETRGTGDISIIPYFGVLLPSGDKMMVHSLNFYARLPNYINTNEPYGPNGATPIIIRN